MKKRLLNHQSSIVILIVLILISVAETIIRAINPEYLHVTTDLGEPLAIAILSIIILIFTLRKKYRACFLLYATFIAWFVLEEALNLIELLSTLGSTISNIEAVAAIASGSAVVPIISIVIHMLTAIGIVTIGAIVIEYMNDGSIYNHAFNATCAAVILLLVVAAIINIGGVAVVGAIESILLLLNNLYRITMVFLFVFFAYDSAKANLEKVDFTK